MLKRAPANRGVAAQNVPAKREHTLANPLRTLFLGKSKSSSSKPSSSASTGELHITTPPKLQHELQAFDTARRQARESTAPSQRLADHFSTIDSELELPSLRATTRPGSVELTSHTPPRLVVKAHSPTQYTNVAHSAPLESRQKSFRPIQSADPLKNPPTTPVRDFTSPVNSSIKFLDSPIDPVMSNRANAGVPSRISQMMSRSELFSLSKIYNLMPVCVRRSRSTPSIIASNATHLNGNDQARQTAHGHLNGSAYEQSMLALGISQ